MTSVTANTPGLYRKDGPSTSKKAAFSIKPGTRRHEVLLVIAWADDGLTRDEIEIETGFPLSTVNPRVRELIDDYDFLYESEDDTRLTRSGKEAKILRVTDKAVAWFYEDDSRWTL